MISDERRKWLENLPDGKRRRALEAMSHRQRRSLRHHWRLWAHEGQRPPPGDWQCWLVMAGRGFGKTRAGAEWVRAVAEADPAARIALVGASLGEVRSVQVEGESGILAVSPWRRRPKFEPSRRVLTWPNGAEARLYSAGEPESLRGPQHSHAWCDEIAKWDNAAGRAGSAWDNLQLGLRLGAWPQAMATTTPRAVPFPTRRPDIMATLLLTAVGTALGGPLGGAIGALVGRQVDAAIVGSPTREGPRVKDLAVQTSSYGAALPLHFGRMRAAGSVIWATDLVEHSEKQGGGKGQPSVVTYSYTTSFAVALASRPIAGVGRVWADGNLLRGAAGDLKAGGQMRIYTGHGDQAPDPLIVQAEGAATCPAFRNTAYVVFEDLELSDFGNRIPSLTFEIFADEADCTLAQIVGAILPEADATALDTALEGFSIDSGRAGDVLATLDGAYALSSALDGERLVIAPAEARPAAMTLLDPPAAGGPKADAVRATGWTRKREPMPERRQSALRYYDIARDYQPGLQRGPGRAGPGDVAVIELPAALGAARARDLAAAAGRRSARPADRIGYRVTTIDPAVRPGAIVNLPVTGGDWRIESWEWQADGVLLDLAALPPLAPASASASDPGRANLPPDLTAVPTVLAAFELPWDGIGNGDTPAIFAAASAATAGWTGAALFARQPGGALASLGAAGRRRALVGTARNALAPASPHFVDRTGRVEIVLAGADLALDPSDLPGLFQGANRALLGEELVQFASAEVLPDGAIALSVLLRGRGGSEWAIDGHAAGELFVLLDDAMTALDPNTIGDDAVTTVLASGLGDTAPVESAIACPGATRRPLSPVHGTVQRLADGSLALAWVRRARGAWLWPDSVDTPLNEQAELWDVVYGDDAAPAARWRPAAESLAIDAATAAALAASGAPAQFRIRQLGSVSASQPLVLAVPA